MKRLLVVSVAVAALMLAAFPYAAPRSLPDAGVNALNTFLSGQVSRGGIPGVVAVVVNREGALFWRVWQAEHGEERPARHHLDLPHRLDDQSGDVGGDDDDGRAGQAQARR